MQYIVLGSLLIEEPHIPNLITLWHNTNFYHIGIVFVIPSINKWY